MTLIIDLGCNVGETTLEFLEQYPDAFVIGIELDGNTAEKARENTSKHLHRRLIVTAAVGWPARDTTAWIDTTDTVSTINPYQHYRLNTFAHPESVHVFTLDEILEAFGFEHEEISILKIDIEGEERNLIDGLGDWLGRTQEIILECHTEEAIEFCTKRLTVKGFKVSKQFADPTRGNHLIARRENA